MFDTNTANIANSMPYEKSSVGLETAFHVNPMQYATRIGQHQVPMNVGSEKTRAKTEQNEKDRLPSSDISPSGTTSSGTVPQQSSW
jgi:hypothetical protein